MKITIRLFFFLVVLVLFTACGGSKVKYKTYHNQFYNYTVEYPDFLIPQGETANQDGQKFISEDQKVQLLVYRDYKNDYLTGGELYSIGEAYNEELKITEGVFYKKLEAKSYLIEYQTDDVLYAVYALISDDNYFNIRFEYLEKEKDMMKSVIDYVIHSFKVEVLDENAVASTEKTSAGSSADMFPAFLGGFLNDCYWGKNFNSLLRNKDKVLATYIDSKMDVRRYFAPGTIAQLGKRAEDFGFSSEDDFVSKAKFRKEVIFKFIAEDLGPCGLDFGDNKVYYQWIEKVPDEVFHTETFETKPVKIVYPNAKIMAVYIPNAYGNPRGFYFVDTPDGWKLAFVDDTLCQA